MNLSIAAGWNQTEADWKRILGLSPGLCCGISIDNTLASSATAYISPENTAWIGMVLTLPEFRGRKLASQLLRHLLDILQRQNISALGLDATDMGKPLYESLGFEAQCAIERWSRPGQPITPQPSSITPGTPLLAALALESTILDNGEATLYLRPGRNANHLGPFTANNQVAAQALLAQIPPEASLFWDLFPDHPYAASLAAANGLTPARRLIRMTLGSSVPKPSPQTLAIAGFEYG